MNLLNTISLEKCQIIYPFHDKNKVSDGELEKLLRCFDDEEKIIEILKICYRVLCEVSVIDNQLESLCGKDISTLPLLKNPLYKTTHAFPDFPQSGKGLVAAQ